MARFSSASRKSGFWLGAMALVLSGTVPAQDGDTQGQRGQFSISYQYNESRNLVATDFTIPTNTLTTSAVDFAVDYAVNDRWTISGGLPLVSRKDFDPTHLHDPLAIVPPQLDSPYLDDGRFHTYWQDLRFGASYRVPTDPVNAISVEPYVQISIPASDYPFFGNAAPGQHLRHTELGTNVGYRPPFLPWYFNLRAGYVWAPSTLNWNINGTRIDGEAIRFLSPRLAFKAFFSSKHADGLPVPAGPIDLTSALWYYHDRFIRHNYINMGVGADWTLNSKNRLEVDWIQMVYAQDVFRLTKAFNFTLSHPFGRATPQSRPGRSQNRPSTFND
jgi:hypothetical protein